ncbi:uncharacterized protein LOC100900003 [Galendromus occidentalis]|uniref:Uncharacterized protein LOC100900003 n=1 Tax=Galendromus occidentalis TaxID=34638 RepID=A0AAJ6QLV5_9ACAR|nr:uncharacterized protein LOC100900003 [Galendromus occidentalis]
MPTTCTLPRAHIRDSSKVFKHEKKLADRVCADKSKDVEGVQRLLESELRDDFTLITGDDVEIKGCREFLSCICTYFSIQEEWNQKEVRVHTEKEITQKFMEFVYSGTISFTNDDVFDLMFLSDFFGCDCLITILVEHMKRSWFPLHLSLPICDTFIQTKGVRAVLKKKLNLLPLCVFNSEDESVGERELGLLELHHMKMMLASDDLMVGSEDDALKLILKWAEVTEASEADKLELIKLIRLPLISRAMQKTLAAAEFDLPAIDPKCFAYSEGCKERRFSDRHVHVFWKEHRRNFRGPVSYAITCLRWNKHTGTVKSENLISFGSDDPAYISNYYSDEYAVCGKAIVRAEENRSRDRIHITEFDLKTMSARTRPVIKLLPEGIMVRDHFLLVNKGEECAIFFSDDRKEMKTYNTITWEVSSGHGGSTSEYPVSASVTMM